MVIAPILLSLATVAAAADAQAPRIITAPDSPVRLESARIVNAGSEPLVLLYAATNIGDSPLDVFTVTVFVFDAAGQLKARQRAPARRDLATRETKYSAMVLDVGKIEPTDVLVAGVDQVQRAGSDEWWSAELRALAESAVGHLSK